MIIMALRDKIKGPVGRALFFVLLLTFFGGLGLSKIFMNLFGGFTGIAKINGIEISPHTFGQMVHEEEEKINHYRSQYGKSADLVLKIMNINPNPQQSALQKTLYTALLTSLADSLHIYISPDYLKIKMSDPYFLRQELGHLLPKEALSNPALALSLIEQHHQSGQLIDNLAKRLEGQFSLMMVQSGFFIPDYALKQYAKELQYKKKFTVQTFDLEAFIKEAKKEAVSQEELIQFFEQQNKQNKRYWVPEERSATQWTFSPKNYGITIAEKDLRDYYDKNKTARFIEKKAEVQVRELILNKNEQETNEQLRNKAQQLQKEATTDPESFIELIKKNSTKDNKKNGGIVDFFAKGNNHDKEYGKAAFRLQSDGAISPVIETDKEFVIMQRVARKDPTYKSFESVKDQIKETLLLQKFKAKFGKDVSALIHNAKDEKALEIFAQEHNGIEKTLDDVKKTEDSSNIHQKLFNIRKINGITGFIEDNKGIVLHLTSLKKAHAPLLKTIQDTVKEDFYRHKALGLLEKALSQAKVKATKEGSLSSLPGTTISKTNWIDPTEEEKVKELISKQDYPDSFISLDWVGAVVTDVTEKGGILIQLTELEEEKSTDSKLKNKTYTALYRHWNRLFLQGFIASLYRDATIEINKEFIQTKD